MKEETDLALARPVESPVDIYTADGSEDAFFGSCLRFCYLSVVSNLSVITQWAFWSDLFGVRFLGNVKTNSRSALLAGPVYLCAW